MNEVLQARLKKAIRPRDKALFDRLMRGISSVAIVHEMSFVIMQLPEEAQAWWTETIGPIVLERARAEQPAVVREANNAWRKYHLGDAKVLWDSIQRILQTSDGLKYTDLMERLERERPSLPHPDCDIKEVAAFVLIELLYRKAVWQTKDCVLHSSEESRIDFPSTVDA